MKETFTPAPVAQHAAKNWKISFSPGLTPLVSSQTPMATMRTEPAKNPHSSVDMLRVKNIAAQKPVKIDRPPKRGMIWEWTFLLSGRSTALIRIAIFLTSGVKQKVVKNAAASGASTHISRKTPLWISKLTGILTRKQTGILTRKQTGKQAVKCK